MRSLISRIIPTFVSGIVLTLAAVIFAFLMSWQLSFILISFASILGFTAWAYGIYGRWKSREMRGIAGKMFRLSYDSFDNGTLLQSFANEGHTISQHNLIVNDLQTCTKTIQLYGFDLGNILGGSASVGDVFTALFIIHLCMTGVQQMYLSYGAFMLAVGSLERLFYIVNFAPKINRPNYNSILEPFEGNLEFSAVNFAYPSRRSHEVSPLQAQTILNFKIFHDVSFKVSPGEVLVITGAGGCGKSTILALVQQFYRPGCGKILLDGKDTATLDPFWIRQQIGIITSDYTSVFSTSVYQNLIYDFPDSELEQLGSVEMKGVDKRVREALIRVGLDDFIQSLPSGYKTTLGENGISLSLVQRQKLLLARVILQAPTILLLDNPTRGLDDPSEIDFLRVLKQVIIEQNPTTIICCDCPQRLAGILGIESLRVVRLLDGKIQPL